MQEISLTWAADLLCALIHRPRRRSLVLRLRHLPSFLHRLEASSGLAEIGLFPSLPPSVLDVSPRPLLTRYQDALTLTVHLELAGGCFESGVVFSELPDAPTTSTCPTTFISRTGSPLSGDQTLDADEASYLASRRNNFLPSLWSTYVSDSSSGATGYNLSQLFSHESYPRISTAISGGGYRAALYGAGSLSALDSRNDSSVAPILQLSDYISGLSGGSWVVGSLLMNDLPDLYSLVLGDNATQTGWKLDLPLLDPAGLANTLEDEEWYALLLAEVQLKAAQGYPISLADLWGRALSFHFYNGTTRETFYNASASHDQGLLWSSIKYTQNFDNFAVPFPIVVSTSRVSATQVSNTTNSIPASNTQFEFTPYTFGSFDPTLSATIPIEYAGTYANNGVPANSSACTTGFENAGFVIGTSACLFNSLESALSSNTTSTTNTTTDSATALIGTVITALQAQLAAIQSDIESKPFHQMEGFTTNCDEVGVPLIANWPNSWANFVPSNSTIFESAGNDILQLTDGGEDGENLPLAPLLVKARGQDAIIALDASGDTDDGWPNGTSLITTASRIAGWAANFSSFPPVPSAEDFVANGLAIRPTFFGCNTTGNGDASVLGNYPIVVYLPNTPPITIDNSTYLTNTSTWDLEYSQADQVSFLDAAHLNAVKGYQTVNATSDADWPLALKCALIDRQRKRAGVARSEECAVQFNRCM
ncbi:lysophospholipase, partial [Phenoliferia sp. Uapishka_3]